MTSASVPSDFPVTLAYDDAASPLFWIIDAEGRKTYSIAGDFNGATVFGRGIRLTLRVTNHSDESVGLRALRVRAQWSRTFPAMLRYRKIITSVPVPPLPFASGQANVRLTEDMLPGGVVRVRGVRGELGPVGGPDSSRVVQVVIEAAVVGLWACRVEMESWHADKTWVSESPVECLILLRGK
jgi:hypothetical protein